tara:strand:- start:515 stop:886 length:372 start_codon:yes stop_codon:yes gene_type:complete
MGLEKDTQNVFEKVLLTFEKLKDTLLFLRNDWKEESPYKQSYVDLPMSFINEYINTLNVVLKNKNYSKKAMDGVNQMIGNFTRNFDNPFFETGKSELIKLLIRDLVDSSRTLDKLLKDHESIK